MRCRRQITHEQARRTAVINPILRVVGHEESWTRKVHGTSSGPHQPQSGHHYDSVKYDHHFDRNRPGDPMEKLPTAYKIRFSVFVRSTIVRCEGAVSSNPA